MAMHGVTPSRHAIAALMQVQGSHVTRALLSSTVSPSTCKVQKTRTVVETIYGEEVAWHWLC